MPSLRPPIQLEWARASRRCANERRPCSTDIVTLGGEIDVENLAYDKRVRVVLWDDVGAAWREVRATYDGPLPGGRERWRFVAKAAELPAGAPLTLRLALLLEVEGRAHWDNRGGADYELRLAEGEPAATVLGRARVLLLDAHADTGAGEVSGTIAGQAAGAAVDVVWSADGWVTTRETAAMLAALEPLPTWDFSLPLPKGARDVELAVRCREGHDESWDSRDGRNHRFGERVAPWLGRWDLTVEGTEGPYASWVELWQGARGLEGRFVGRLGSARPLEDVRLFDDELSFSLPPQAEPRQGDLVFRARRTGDGLSGTTFDDAGHEVSWSGQPAPALPTRPVTEGAPRDLLAGPGLEGFRLHPADLSSRWERRGDVLVNTGHGANLVTLDTFTDFRLRAEVRLPPEGNSGIFLRGRYELQLKDSAGRPPSSLEMGGLYGFLRPSENAGRGAGEWQQLDVTLIGRELTVVLNGKTVIEREEIPGITGAALDADEGAPGPLLLQGDHTAVELRALVLTPLEPLEGRPPLP